MTENIYRNFTLENSLAAISAIPFESHTLATDGTNCVIHRIENGNCDCSCKISTFRPLRRLRSYSFSQQFTALGCCGDNNLYFFNENLCEVGLVKLNGYSLRNCGCNSGINYYVSNCSSCGSSCGGSSCGSSCGCGNGSGCNNGCYNDNNGCGCGGNGGCGSNSDCVVICNNGSGNTHICGDTNLSRAFARSCAQNSDFEITDASLARIGNENYIVGAFRNGAYLFDMNGNPLTQLCKVERNEILTDFIYLQNGYFAMSTLCGSIRTLTLSDGDKTQSRILEKNLSLRMLIDHQCEIYGLFGENYIYNRIIKINF